MDHVPIKFLSWRGFLHALGGQKGLIKFRLHAGDGLKMPGRRAGRKPLAGLFWAAWAAWGAILLLLSKEHFLNIRLLLGSLSQPVSVFPMSEIRVSLHGIFSAVPRHLGLLAFTACFAFVCQRVGLRVLRAAPPRGATGWERVFLGLGLGWGVLATACFGLSLTGLYTPGVILSLLPIGLVAGSGERRRDLGRSGSPGCFLGAALAFGAPFFLLFPLFLVPSLYVDVFQYHLAAPEHFLKLHRYAMEGTNQGFHMSILGEMLNAYGLILGYEALAQILPLIPYFAGLFLASAWILRVAGPAAAGAAFGLALTIQSVIWVTLSGKNDLAEVGYCLMAFIAMGRGWNAIAGSMWGMACAVKMNGYVFAGLAWLWHEGERLLKKRAKWRLDAAWLILLAAFALPWLAKTWLTKGDPLWPVLSNWLPGSLWDRESSEAVRIFVGDRPGPIGILKEAWGMLRDWIPAILFLLPAVILGYARLPRALKRLGILAVLSYAVYAAVLVKNTDRMSLPLLSFFCYVGICAAFTRVKTEGKTAKRVLAAAVCVFAWLPAAGGVQNAKVSLRSAFDYLLGSMTRDDYFGAVLTSFAEAQAAASKLTGLGTVMLVSEGRCYGWPGKAWVEDMWGRVPPWVMTRECGSVERAEIWFKQRNITHVAFNFYTGGYVVAHEEVFEWDDRQLGLWRDFLKTRTKIVHISERSEHGNGGFYIYRLRADGGNSGGGWVFSLPGIKSVWWRICRPMVFENDFPESRRRALEYSGRFPDVGEFRMVAGYISTLMRDWGAAYKCYRPLIEAGMVGVDSGYHFGRAALMTGRYDEGLAALRKAGEMFPDRKAEADTMTAQVYARIADNYLAGPVDPAKALEFAQKACSIDPKDPWVGYVMGRVLIAKGRFTEAERILREVLDSGFGRMHAAKIREEIESCRR